MGVHNSISVSPVERYHMPLYMPTYMGAPSVAVDNLDIADPKQRVYTANMNAVIDALHDANFPGRVIPFVLDQVLHETGAFSSDAYNRDNNASGIMPYGLYKKGYTKYAHFRDLTEWAHALKAIISRGSRPIDATTLPDYVKRLKANRYFEAPVSQYLTGAGRFHNSVMTWLSTGKPGAGGNSLYAGGGGSGGGRGKGTGDKKNEWLKWVLITLGGVLAVKAIST